MKSLRTRIIVTVLGIGGYLTLLMWLFLGLYFLRDPGYLTNNPGPFWLVAGFMIITAGVLLYVLCGPISRVQKLFDNNQQPTENQSAAARRAMSRLPIFIVVFKGIAFFIGPAISVVLGALRGTIEFSVIRIVYSMLFSGGIGLMAGIQAIFMVNILLQGLRAHLQIYSLQADEKRSKIRHQQIAVALAIAVFLGGIFIGMSYGYLSNPMEQWQGRFVIDTIILGIITLSIAFVTIMAAATDQQRRLHRIGVALQELSSGTTANFKRIEIISPDEIGVLTHALNKHMYKQETANQKIRETAKDVLDSSRTLEDTVIQMNQVANNTLSATEQVKQHAKIQDQAIVAVEEVLKILVEKISRVSENVQTQASYVEESSASVTQMTANIASVSETTKKAGNLTQDLDTAANTGSDSIQETLGAIRDIEDAANEVSSIVQTMGKISAQTNLLAMNAAIEAAHAGDMGRGFAVVADEVRKLANESSSSAKGISQKIKDMVQRVGRGVSASEKAFASFNRVTQGVVETRDLTQSIAQAMAEQKTGAAEILDSVNYLVQATNTISTSAQDQKTYSNEIQTKMAGLHQAFSEISQAVANQEIQAQQLRDTVEYLEEVVRTSKGVSDKLESILTSGDTEVVV